VSFFIATRSLCHYPELRLNDYLIQEFEHSRMKWMLFALLSVATISAHGLDVSLALGMYTDHKRGDTFTDYRTSDRSSPTGPYPPYEVRPMNDGSVSNNRLIALLVKSDDVEWGLCTFKNSYYDTTWCGLANMTKHLGHGFSAQAGLNVSYGYRAALVEQDPTASMAKMWVALPQAGLRYQLAGRHSLSFDASSIGAYSLSYVLKLY